MTEAPAGDPIMRELESAIAGRYSLERELGRGGMGAVYLARDLRLDRPVAIKVLPPELAVRPELRERFLRETRTAASFSHPNIVSVHAVEETPGLLYFVMSYIEGETLSQRVKRQGPLPVPEALRLLQEVAWALSYAHGRGVVHRDIKPDNVLLEKSTGRALVMDFGIARSVAASGLTQVGEAVGTPHFMSPEQAAGDAVDGRSDLYSLGVVGYYATTGRLPFDGDTAQAVMVAHISQPAAPVARYRPDLPGPLAAAIDRCLAKAPDQRFATGEALVEALDQVRGRQVEVSPAIRVWAVRADQFFRNGLILALVVPQLVRFQGENGRVVLAVLLFAVVIPALWAQIPFTLRELARQGISFPDLQNGITAIDAEREAVLDAMRADPRYPARRRRRWLAIGLTFLISALVMVLGISTSVEVTPGHRTVSAPVMVLLLLGMCGVMGSLIFGIATIATSGRLDRRIHRLWTGRVGRALYRLATWRMADLAPAAAPPITRGALTLLEALPVDTRRRLAKTRRVLDGLEREVARLDQRDRELDAAAGDARSGGATLAGGAGERQRALLAEVYQVRRANAERRLALLDAIEQVRLALVRVKSGLGTAEDVDRQLADAERVQQ
ncbi:MAG TPA: serine/threonine-protein kinase [Gemmatimonadales bacterium]|nr:serine/threonine-protein kinase [Gemmatimonadales bacterium]